MRKSTALIILLVFLGFSSIITGIIRSYTPNSKKIDNGSTKEVKEIDKTPPILELKDNKLVIYQNTNLNYEGLILEAKDETDGDLFSFVEHNIIDTSKIGVEELKYKVKDKAGNETIKTIKVTIRENFPVVEG